MFEQTTPQGPEPSRDETHLRVLRLLQANPELSQRELADALGVSLGKANYCLRALLEKGLVKVRNFKNHRRKRAYAYLLTPEGVAAKGLLAARFLKRKVVEYDRLRAEIDLLRVEVAASAEEREQPLVRPPSNVPESS